MQDLSHWPLESRRQIRGVFTDIDDTLTHEGRIAPEALQALGDLQAAGLTVIPITGRPIGWCEPFMTGTEGPAWPVDAMVAENGAVAFIPAPSVKITSQNAVQPTSFQGKSLSKLYQLDSAMRAANRARMRAIAAQVQAEVPGVTLSRDSPGRETDLAFDYAEFAQHPPETVQRVLAILQQHGMQTTLSSIHIHGCFGNFNKWHGANWIVRTLLGRTLTQELEHWVFVGDSGNDQPMFQHFRHSVGVANIARFAPQLSHLPGYITPSKRGAGFAEVAHAILKAHTL